MRQAHGKDTASFVISDIENAVIRGRKMIPKLRRRWICKYGALRTDTPSCTPEQREKFNQLKAEYLELLQLANSMGNHSKETFDFAVFPLNL
ncbi:TPA: hypothetical protein ACN37W_004313 [Vibrio parahaemolyticus]